MSEGAKDEYVKGLSASLDLILADDSQADADKADAMQEVIRKCNDPALIKNAFDYNLDVHGVTLLHNAAFSNSSEVVKVLYHFP